MAKQKLVTIKNGDLESRVLPGSVAAWERNGWTAVDDGSSEASPEVKAEGTPEEQVTYVLPDDKNEE